MGTSIPAPFSELFQLFTTFDKVETGHMLLIGGAILVGMMVLRILGSMRQPSTTYGSAHFARYREIKPLVKRIWERRNCLHLGSSRTLIPYPVGLTDKQQESHMLVCAPSGKGKTACIIIPGLLQEDGHRSLFINDIKRELINLCMGALQAKGYTCLVLSPTRPEESHRYNPLMHVASMEDAEALAECLVSNTGTSDEPFWNNAAKLLLTATILHLRTADPQAPLSSLTDILCGNSMTDMMHIILNSPSKLARSVASSFLSSLTDNAKLAGSILADMSSRLLGLQNPNVAAVTAEDEFDFATFIDQPTAFILSIPASDTARLKWLSATFTMQLMSYTARRAEQSKQGRLPRHVAFYLDEFSNMGVVPNFLKQITLVRSAGIAFLLAIQNFAQLQNTYGPEGLETVLAGTATHVIFSGCGQKETEFYAKRMGEHTIQPQSKSVQGNGWTRSQRTTSESEAARALMTPDELRTMKINQLLILSENLPPIRLRSKPYFKQPHLKKWVQLPEVLPYRPFTIQEKLSAKKPEQTPEEEQTPTNENPLQHSWLPLE